MKFKDMTGQVFGDITALSHQGSDEKGNALWLFQCVCGNLKVYKGRAARKGEATSCGCKRVRTKEIKKICRHCGNLSDRRNQRGGYASVCQKCNNKQTNAYKIRNPKYQLVCSARARAKQFGVPCSINPSDVVVPEFCPIFGIKLESGNRKFHDSSPSLDRIIPELGYVPGNIAVMSFRANRFKNDASSEELRLIANWIDANAPKIELVA